MSTDIFRDLCVYIIFITGISGIVSIQVSNTVSNQPAILGGSVTLQCSFTLVTATEAASASILLKRKRQGDSGFSTIVSIPFSTFDRFNASYIDTSLESRTVATNPENSESSSVSFRFNNVECRDVAQYQWVVNYNTGIDQKEERTSDVTVKAEGTFSGSTDFGLTHSPDTQDVAEITKVTFRCKAELGSEPTGQLAWYYYPDGSSSPVSVSDQASKEALTVYNTCSYTQVSTLVLTMTQQLNGVVVRCALQQDSQSPEGDNGNEHRQTNPFNVSYSPGQTTVAAYPYHAVYSEGDSSVTLTCSAVANPTASYSWILPNGSEIEGRSYQLQNLQINDTGNYTCLAKNGIPNEKYRDSYTHKVVVMVVVEMGTTARSVPDPVSDSGPGPGPDPGPKISAVVGGVIGGVIGAIIVALISAFVIAIIVTRYRKALTRAARGQPAGQPTRDYQDLHSTEDRPNTYASLDESSGNSQISSVPKVYEDLNQGYLKEHAYNPVTEELQIDEASSRTVYKNLHLQK